MRLVLHLLSITLGMGGLCSCSSQYNIDGNSTISGLDGQKLYLRTNMLDGKPNMVCLDSCEVIHGCFSFDGAIDSVIMAELYMGNEPMMPVVVENGKVFVQMDNMMQSISGGPLNDRLNQFLTKHGRYEYELWDLNRRARDMVYQGKSLEQIVASIDPIKNSLLKNMKSLEVQFIKDNYNNVLGPGYFMRMCTSMGMPAANDDILDILVNAPDAFLKHPFVGNYLLLSGLTPEQLKAARAQQASDKKHKKRNK